MKTSQLGLLSPLSRTLTWSGLSALLLTTALPLAQAAREMSTDRPDATESPFTVEPGRIQVETSLVSYERDRHNPERDDTKVDVWNVAPFNIRIGLTPAWELQVVADSYLDVKVESRSEGYRVRQRGIGDLTLRVKYNVWGNDGGESALGIMPFVKLPTASDDLGNDSVEGGVIFAYGSNLNETWGFGAMTEIDWVRNEEDDGYDWVWLNTVTVGRDLTDRLGMFLELTLETGPGKPAATFNTGTTYAVTEDFQLDLGLNFGLTRAAPDLGAFVGMSRRF
ncbi:MAG TPA: transporter [Opitutaceae bacterium]|nr:transporter [Opitutaceae bacterium]